jgi:hypothetical protein
LPVPDNGAPRHGGFNPVTGRHPADLLSVHFIRYAFLYVDVETVFKKRVSRDGIKIASPLQISLIIHH